MATNAELQKENKELKKQVEDNNKDISNMKEMIESLVEQIKNKPVIESVEESSIDAFNQLSNSRNARA